MNRSIIINGLLLIVMILELLSINSHGAIIDRSIDISNTIRSPIEILPLAQIIIQFHGWMDHPFFSLFVSSLSPLFSEFLISRFRSYAWEFKGYGSFSLLWAAASLSKPSPVKDSP